MPDLLEPLGYAFFQRALIGAVLVGIVCAAVGVFVVLRGLAFLGDAVAHIAFPGVVLAYLAKADLVIGGAVAAVGGALAIGLIGRRSGLREDTIIGVVFSGMFALGVVLFSSIPSYTGDLLGVLLGDVLGVSAEQLWLGAVTGAAIVAILYVTWKELVFTSFDPTGAAAAGIPVVRYDVLLLVIVGLAIAISIQMVGVVLVVALLVTPAATARLLARRMRAMVWLAIGLAAFASSSGIYLSYYLNTASGGTIVLVATTLFLLVWAYGGLARGRGGLTAPSIQGRTPVPD
jgi:manganese/iron transport system permease protein